jgi:hypothetical protein
LPHNCLLPFLIKLFFPFYTSYQGSLEFSFNSGRNLNKF